MELYSPYLFALVLAWFLSHVVKYVAISVKEGFNSKRRFFGSGGMPSAHTATITAVWMVILLKDGWTSGLLGIATVVLVIVAYDAATVRRSVGQQRHIVSELAKKEKIATGELYESHGHTPLEVVGGILFGLLVGVIVYYGTSSWLW